MSRISGNDISDYQGNVDWNIYKSNTNFVIIKATEGVNFTAKTLRQNQEGARNNGVPLGYYHFARPEYGNDPIAEADFFLKQIGELRDGEVLCLDYESNPKQQSHVDWCKRFLDRVFDKTGVRSLIYMSESVVVGLDWSVVVNGGYGLWIAKYLNNPTPDATFNAGKWPFAAMYQWTSGQKVPGIPVERVDGDVFYGDVATFKKYGYKKPTPPPPPVNWEQKYNEEVAKSKDLEQKLNSANSQITFLQTKIDNAKRDLS